MAKKRIIIAGGGFGGVQCARKLAGEGEFDVVLFNSENHLVFSPLLAEVAGSSISPLDVVVPLRQLLPNVFCRTEEIQNIHLDTNEVEFLNDIGEITRMSYDQLVIGCGNITNLNAVPGMADHAFPLKTVADAAALRSHIMEEMERAEVCTDPQRRCWHLTFIVVGGGFSGAEAAGEINDLVRSTSCYFRNFRESDVKVILIHSRDQILPEISSHLRDFARKKMEKAGVEMVLNARVSFATPEGVGLQDGKMIKGGTIVCTVGSSSSAVIERLKVPKEKGRVLTDPDMRLRGCKNVWAIGDCALIVNSFDKQPAPTTGQFAEREGKQCGENILRALHGEETKPFYFKQLGELCSIGGHSAVADLFGLHLSGFLAWFVWRGVYLFKLPTWGRRLQVGFDWAWLLIFPRDLAHIRTRHTDRVSQAHYQPGDLIIEHGDPATNFYVIKKGEVEVVRATAKDPKGEVVAVLGPGSFFGEKALMSNEPRVADVRARTEVDVLVMGKNIFTQISGTLAPLRDALAQALNRRALQPWKDQSDAYDLLKRTSLKTIMEPVPQPLLKPDTTLSDVSRAFVEHANEFFYVSSDNKTLEGVVTITDILRGRGSGATATTPVSEFMTRNPVALSADDDCAIASAAIREYRLKTLPVVESKNSRALVGCIRVRRLMAFVLKEIRPEPEQRPVTPAPVAAGTPT
ncbi:MAG TPA: FAD-dependent oxidoreductase [Candidatus Dormibacteraeota bacterium]|nr:FAD-dependent oxidoreductase [Candidatus Dormibacteraeota bacterium]